MEVARRSVEVQGVPVHYQVAGKGPPLVLIHGLSGSSRWWRRNITGLAERLQVYVVDLIGFGASRGQHRFVLHEAAGVLGAWMQCLGLECASLVGHSMGGLIALELAADMPACVERLVLVDAALLPPGPRLAFLASGAPRALRSIRLSFLPVLVGDALRAGPATLTRALRDLLLADVRAKLRRVEAPTLVIWGQQDRLVPLSAGVEICQLLSNARLLVLPRAGHNPMWDQPRAFNQAVLQFVAGA